jgi:hypothetical protein
VIRQCNVDSCGVGYLIRLCNLLVSTGFCVVIVCDGPTRHHSKRSSTKRLSDSYSNKIKLHRNNTFLMSLLGKKNSTDRLEECARPDDAIRVVGARISTLQSSVKKSNIDVGVACYNKIKHVLPSYWSCRLSFRPTLYWPAQC